MSEITAELAASGGKGNGRGVRGAGEAAKGHNVREKEALSLSVFGGVVVSVGALLDAVGGALVFFCCKRDLFVV